MMHWIFPFAAGIFIGAAFIWPIACSIGKSSAFNQLSDEIAERREANRLALTETVDA
jgi:hypothetical protein